MWDIYYSVCSWAGNAVCMYVRHFAQSVYMWEMQFVYIRRTLFSMFMCEKCSFYICETYIVQSVHEWEMQFVFMWEVHCSVCSWVGSSLFMNIWSIVDLCQRGTFCSWMRSAICSCNVSCMVTIEVDMVHSQSVRGTTSIMKTQNVDRRQ